MASYRAYPFFSFRLGFNSPGIGTPVVSEDQTCQIVNAITENGADGVGFYNYGECASNSVKWIKPALNPSAWGEFGMRLIITGCEYAGTTTLADNIGVWVERSMGGQMGVHDHWKIPELSHRPHTREENEAFLALSPALQECFQRYHMEYHLSESFYSGAHHVLVGFYIDEAVYAPKYYGYGGPDEYSDRALSARKIESHIMRIAGDTVLIHLRASPEAIRQRMQKAPRKFGLVKDEDIEYILQRFQEEYKRSFLRQKIQIDNTVLTPEQTLAAFVERIQPHLSEADRARILTRNLPE